MKKEDLIKLIEDDDLGLLSIKTTGPSAISANERLITSFVEINNFVKENGREPKSENSLPEHQLSSRLNSIREDKAKIEALKDYDECDLLSKAHKTITSIKDILDDEELKMLDDTDENLFQLRNVSSYKNRNNAEYVAHRKPCSDFEKYEDLFVNCQQRLKRGELKLKKLEKHYELQKGSFFVLGGIVGLIVKTFGLSINNQKKINGRLYIVFENGTESNMLLQSLIKSMQDLHGKLITEAPPLLDREVTEKDTHSGYIYILRSLSDSPKIKSIENLFKIGYSTIPVEERIKNSNREPAFLMAPVKNVTTFECYNFNPQKLEQLLHNFFGASCLNIDIFDENNNRFMPREWFIAPLEVIEKVVRLVINEGIVNYRYDPETEEIRLR